MRQKYTICSSFILTVTAVIKACDVSCRLGEIAMFDITLFLTLSALVLIGLTITSTTLHHFRLDIDKWGDKVIKTVLTLHIFVLQVLHREAAPRHMHQCPKVSLYK